MASRMHKSKNKFFFVFKAGLSPALNFNFLDGQFSFKTLEDFQVVKNTQHNSQHNKNQATMPQEVRQKMKDMHDDVEKVSHNDEDQYCSNGQES